MLPVVDLLKESEKYHFFVGGATQVNLNSCWILDAGCGHVDGISKASTFRRLDVTKYR